MQSIISILDSEEINNVLDKSFRKKQITDFVYNQNIIDFEEMSNLPNKLVINLKKNFTVLETDISDTTISRDGTVKFLFKLKDNTYIESVLLKDINDRFTFCISSQSGCRMGCTFCSTGKMGLVKNLSPYEILSQVLYLLHYMRKELSSDKTAFNIVFMGMGEPLDNLANLKSAIHLITDNKKLGLSPSRITISTCGLIDNIREILSNFPTIRIAVSLNSSIQERRESIMPIAKKHSINEIAETLKSIYRDYKNRITLEFVLIKNFNMDETEIKGLELFKHEAFHINIIPVNSNSPEERPSTKEVDSFISKLKKRGVNVTQRFRRGADIAADCGNLYWDSKKSHTIS